jgi:sugar/nucleoside kinase (ribokinase family)
MEYDENEYMRPRAQIAADLQLLSQEIRELLKHDAPIPEAFHTPRVIHLITEYYHDQMYRDALALKQQGATLSIEPLIDHRNWTNREQTLEAMAVWDVMSPDWPSASGLADSDDPATVVRFLAERGPAFVSVRHGARGSYVWDKVTCKAWHIPPTPVTPVDPTGAGNAYGGGAMVGWDKYRDGLVAGAHGAVSASFLVERVGLPLWSRELFDDANRRLQITIEQARPL